MQRLKTLYLNNVVPKFRDKFKYQNNHQIPQLEKIIINIGFGQAYQNSKALDSFLHELMSIAGQRGVVTFAKKAIAGFKVREGTDVGMYVTLRGERMYGFLDRLINLSLPRIRDFQGLNPDSFDGLGNYSMGLDDQLMFPEVSFDKVQVIQGMDISIVTTSNSDEEGKFLLQSLGMPFKFTSSSSHAD